MSAILTRLTDAFAGRYLLERELGRGGMATVYLARDLKHRRPVALKLLHVDIMSVGGVERFLREIELTAKLQHPHILPLLDSGEVPFADAQGRPSQGPSLLYYIMPYVEGMTLQARMAAGPLPVPEAVRILRDVVDALAAAHNFGVVHRDIKPQNIMLSGRHAMVMDFGVAKALRAAMPDDQLTATGMVVGTPAYMAPEQVAADPRVDHRADLYSVGVVAYEMLAGRRPSGAEPLRRHRQDLPEELERVVMKCLAAKAGDRWQTAEELLERLEALAATGDRASADSLRLRRTRGLVVGVSALILGGFIGAALLSRGDRETSGGMAPAERQVTFSGKVTHAALSPDGRMLAYTWKDGAQSRLVVQDLSGGQAVQADSFLMNGELDWSPDGANLALAARLHDSTFGLFVLPRLGGSRRWVGQAFLTRWSPDGKRLAGWFHPMKSILIIDVATLDTTRLPIPGTFEWLANVAWSPAGDRLAFQTASPGRYVTGVTATDGSDVGELTVDSTPVHGVAWAPEADALYYRRGDEIRKIPLSPPGPKNSLPILRGGGDPEWWQTRSLSVSADGSRLAYLKSTRYSNLWLATREGTERNGRWMTKRLTTGTADRRVPAISPDGRWVAYAELRAGRSDVLNGFGPLAALGVTCSYHLPLETTMRYLLYTAFVLAACGRADTARDTRVGDTAAPSAPAPDRAMSAVPDRLLGTWTAQGYDAGSNRAQQFTITWTRAPDGGLVGTIAFRPGETYNVKVVSTSDTTIVYESDPHHSPTLKAQVVTRTQARLVGDSLMGTYEARATEGGKVLRGRFTAKQGSAP